MNFRAFFVAAISAAAMLLQAQTKAVAADSGAENAGGLEEIVVTARKKSEDILKTPVSVSALTSEDIQVRGIVTLNDLANSTPGININTVNSGRSDRSFQSISLRGFTPSVTASTLTASFIDGVPVSSPTALNSITDPERIEILKGPQSAYFGRNTFAGAVNVVNKLPGKEFGGDVSAVAGTRKNTDFKLSLEGPLFGDWLSFRLTGRSYGKNGSYLNGANNSQTLGDQSTNTGTLLLVLKPTENFSAKFFGLLTHDDDGPSAQGMLSAYELRANNGVTNIPALSGNSLGTLILPSASNCTLNGYASGNSAAEARVIRPFVCGAVPSLIAPYSPAQNTVQDSLLRSVLADPAYRVISPSDGAKGYGLVRGYAHLHLNLDYELPELGLTLSSLTGLNDEYFSELADLDNYDNSLIRNPANPTGANINLRTSWDFPFVVEGRRRDFSQELRAAYDQKGAFSGLIGYSHLLTKTSGDLVNVNSQIINGAPRIASTTNAPAKVVTDGVFFSANYRFTDQFKLSAEGRYQADKVYGYTGGLGLTIAANNQFGLTSGTFAPLTNFLSKKYTNFLPRVIFQWDVNPDMMAYASYSKGVNVGISSFNTSFLAGSSVVAAAAAALGLKVTLDPEKITNYELGFKAKFLDGRLRAQLAFYRANWDDQLNNRSAFVQDFCAVGCTNNIQIVTGVANSGEAVVQGIELDVLAAPVNDLRINFAAAMNDSNIHKFSDPSASKYSGVIDSGFSGHQLPATSKYSMNLGAQYGRPIASVKDGSWFVRGDVSWKDKQYLDAANLTWINSRTQVNVRGGVSKGALSLEAFANNLFNDKNYVGLFSNTPLVPNFAISATLGYVNVALPELRTVGVKATYKF